MLHTNGSPRGFMAMIVDGRGHGAEGTLAQPSAVEFAASLHGWCHCAIMGRCRLPRGARPRWRTIVRGRARPRPRRESRGPICVHQFTGRVPCVVERALQQRQVPKGGQKNAGRVRDIQTGAGLLTRPYCSSGAIPLVHHSGTEPG